MVEAPSSSNSSASLTPPQSPIELTSVALYSDGEDSSEVRVNLPNMSVRKPPSATKGVKFSRGKIRPKLYATADDFVPDAQQEADELHLEVHGKRDASFDMDDMQSDAGTSDRGSALIRRAMKGKKLKELWYKIPLLHKMIFIVGLPTLGMLVLTSMLLIQQTEEISDSELENTLAEYLRHTEDLISTLQVERGKSELYLELQTSELAEALLTIRINETDPAITEYLATTDASGLEADGNVLDFPAMKNVISGLYSISHQRRQFDDNKLSMDDLDEFYSGLIENLIKTMMVAVGAAVDPYTKELFQIVTTSAELTEHMDHERTLGSLIIFSGKMPDFDTLAGYFQDVAHVGAVEATLAWTIDSFFSAAPLEIDWADEDEIAALEAEREVYRGVFMANDTGEIQQMDMLAYYANISRLMELRRSDRSQIIGLIQTHAGENETAASSARITLVIILVFAIALSAVLLTALVGSIRMANKILSDEVKKRRSTEKAIWRFFPHEFMTLLNRTDVLNIQAGEKRRLKMCVMFADIRNFTGVSEMLGGEQTYDWLMDYVQHMGPIVKSHNGFIDKVLGDGIMALFTESQDALDCAVAMQIAAEKMNLDNVGTDLPDYNVGIGLHTGDVILGVIGDNHRLEGTTVSDTVNTASRIEGLCKYYQSKIVISGTTYDECDMDAVGHRFLGSVRCVGKQQPVQVFDVFESDRADVRRFKQRTRGQFELSIRAFQEGRFGDCEKAMEDLHAEIPMFNDGGIDRRIRLCQQMEGSQLPDGWAGEDVMTQK